MPLIAVIAKATNQNCEQIRYLKVPPRGTRASGDKAIDVTPLPKCNSIFEIELRTAS
jgi:hypothetical protein